MASLVGIVNLTSDSFSDGGRFLDPEQAIAHGEELRKAGADWLDLGAESSNPSGQKVTAEVEISRLRPVIEHFTRQGVPISVDTYRPEVIEAVLALGAGMINDITALKDPRAVEVLASSTVPVVIMFARNAGPRAEEKVHPYRELLSEIKGFFEERLSFLEERGIARDRVILDPGMGFFLGKNPEPSLWVLKNLSSLLSLGRPLYVSTSRKSFIGTILNKPPKERAAGTLATELWALHQGASYIRTHDVASLSQAYALWRAIEGVE